MLAILVGVQWYFNAILIFIPLVNKDSVQLWRVPGVQGDHAGHICAFVEATLRAH